MHFNKDGLVGSGMQRRNWSSEYEGYASLPIPSLYTKGQSVPRLRKPIATKPAPTYERFHGVATQSATITDADYRALTAKAADNPVDAVLPSLPCPLAYSIDGEGVRVVVDTERAWHDYRVRKGLAPLASIVERDAAMAEYKRALKQRTTVSGKVEASRLEREAKARLEVAADGEPEGNVSDWQAHADTTGRRVIVGNRVFRPGGTSDLPYSPRVKAQHKAWNRDDNDPVIKMMREANASDLSLFVRGRSRIVQTQRKKARAGEQARLMLWWNAEERKELAKATKAQKPVQSHMNAGRSNARLAKRLQGRLGMRYQKAV